MNDEELKKIWRQQPLRKPDVSPEKLISALQKKMSQLRRTLDARDLRELVACALVVIIFGILYFTAYRTPVSRIGVLIVIGGAIFIAWKLVHTRRTTPPAPPGATVVESLQAELKAARAQSRLLGSVLWWYLMPLTVGELVATWGMATSLWATIPVMLVIIAVNALVYWLNQWARNKQLLPLEAQLESLIRSVETGEPCDQTGFANLRPIVLSMQSAEHVKPVEFKVAFWQLAIYGVPGIVGIWFILVLNGTMRNDDWKVNERAVENPAPMVRTVETNEANRTNRYFIATRKLVDLINAGDYAAVQQLYNSDMGKVFPPKETTAFYTRLATALGRIENFDGPTDGGTNGWTAFRLHYQHAEITMSLALDADDKISGIHFKPESTHHAIGPNIKPFLRRFFSWQHLLWGVLSFLGGLTYTWLIQKTVKRAVGISSLGIHLQQGMNLILWDEINEVRPFKLLNIRNLWLIKESGEKTLMHWTPLERHSDLRAAVEKSAPVNHPIRQYLPLLKTKPSKKTS